MILYILAFISSYLFIKFWEGFARKKGLVGRDMNKPGEVYVPEGGGIPVFFVILLFSVYLLKLFPELNYILVPTTIGFLIGTLDDIWKPGGLPWKLKLLLSVFVPLSLLPFLDPKPVDFYFFRINSAILFYFFAIFFGVIWTNAINTLAGLNGLEVSLSMIILVSLAFFIPFPDRFFIFLVVFILLAFFIENWYPARIFPGDSLTYGIGALISVFVMKYGLFWQSLVLLVPYVINWWKNIGVFTLSLLGVKKIDFKEFAKKRREKGLVILKDRSLDFTNPKHNLITMIAWMIKKMKRKAYEWEIVTLTTLLYLPILLILLL